MATNPHPSASAMHRALGLTDSEADMIREVLGREPNHLELAMYSVMWSEHCSYKSSRLHLRRLPTEAPHVLVGPGEGAGVIDLGDGIAAAFRIESHNHPSAIEPYQGAATGVGGIVRDVFSVGARPIALLDALRFGPLTDPRSRWIAEGVVSGVSGYGNSVGVPTVGGELVFDEAYRENPLVNVFCLGLAPQDRLVRARASGAGDLAVLVGAHTGRDGIGGASVLASAGFDGGEQGKRPSVQVGDPFEEKRLIEACLEMVSAGLVVGMQDLGAAGIAGAASEISAKGGVGMDVHLSAVHVREPGMAPFEVMISESQERMLAIVAPDRLEEALAVCARWEVHASVVGTVTGTGRFRVLDRPGGEALADLPAASLDEGAPLYDRPLAPPSDRAGRRAVAGYQALAAPADPGADLLGLLADPRWAWRQYDHQLFLNTVLGPGEDAAVLRLKHPLTGADTSRGLALTIDGNHRWCALDPRQGTALVVAEAVANLACVAARPLGLVNNLNFGNPEHPEVMWQLSEAVDGMGEACRAWGIPVVGGNVSLYNESRGVDIPPTPVVGVLGCIDRLDRPPPGARLVAGCRILVVGAAAAELSGSRWAWERGHRAGAPPALDLAGHAAVCDLVRRLVQGAVQGAVPGAMVAGAHDLAEGLGPALAEMAARSGVGATVELADHAALFAESPSRFALCAASEAVEGILREARAAGVAAVDIGSAGGDRLVLGALVDLPLAQVAAAWRDRVPAAMAAGATH